jgi:hypothetical protein
MFKVLEALLPKEPHWHRPDGRSARLGGYLFNHSQTDSHGSSIMTRFFRSWLQAVSGTMPTWRRSFFPRVYLLEDRTLPSVQFTPAPYAVPANRPDTPLTSMSGIRPVEPYVSVNPVDPGDIAVSAQTGIRVSIDAAGAFTGATAFPASPAGDTSTTYDSAGRLFWVNLTTSGGLSGVTIAQVNPTNGSLISTHVVDQVPDNSFSDDRDWIAADPSNNNLYVTWIRYGSGDLFQGEVLISYSSNEGQSWSAPVRLDNGHDGRVGGGESIAVTPDHMVYAAYHSVSISDQPDVPNHDGKTVVVRLNSDLTNPVRSIAEVAGRADVTFNRQDRSSRTIPGAQFYTWGSVQPWILADPVRPGNIYVISEDSNNGFHQDYGDIRIARSTNSGLTWSSSLIETSSALFPNAAIDQFGDIVVAWYDNRRSLDNAAGHFKLDVYATYSTDGGLTFAPAFPVNDQTPGVNTPNGNIFDPDPGAVNEYAGPPPTTRIGEYFGIGISGGTVYVAWNGNTFASFDNPINQQVWLKSFAIRGSLTVTGTSGNDYITIRSMADNPDYVEVLVNGERQYAGLWSALTGITLNPTAGNDYIQIDDTVPSTPLTVNLGDGADTVDIGPAGVDLDRIQGPVVVHGGSGNDTLFLRDANHASNVAYTVAGSVFSRTGCATVSYDHVAIVNLGAGNVSTVHVLGTLPSTLRIGGYASPDLVIDDGSNTANTTYTVTASSVGWTGSSSVTLNHTLTNLILTGGSGNNTYNFSSTPSLSSNTLNTGSGIDTVNVRGTAGPLYINSGSSGDTVTLRNNAGTLGGIGYIVVNDPSNSTEAIVDDSGFSDSTTYSITSTQVAAAAWPNFLLVYNNLASLNLDGSGGDDSFAIESTASSTATTITGGSGSNRFDLAPTAQYLADVAGPLNLLGSGADTLVFWDQANPNAETYTFDDIPSMLALATVPAFATDWSGMATVYLETNHMSTVNDPSGSVQVDVPPPGPPDAAQQQGPTPVIAVDRSLMEALFEPAQKRNTGLLWRDLDL